MRAAVFEGYRSVVVRDLPDPEPGPGDVRLTVGYCGICGSDLSLFKTGIMSGPDRVLGHEIAGVVETPAGGWRAGDRVVPLPVRGCGECAWCARGQPRYCLEPLDRYGGFAERVTYPAENLVPIPEGLDDRTAALAEPLGVAARAVRLAEVALGDVVYASGLGSIGLLTVAAAVDAGARVVGGDPREDRRALGLELGCEDAFDPTAEDPFWKMFAYDPLGPRVAMECSGVPSALQLAFNTARHGGVVGILGIPFEPVPIIPAVLAVKELRAFSISGPNREDIVASLDLLARRPEIRRVATSVVPLEETGAAMARLADGEGSEVKVLVDPRS
ncbi:MAG TPA: alcohol dehydrogenase catalytic domain-containing protein [Actinomycetota bacterium]|nr:alcohol dehydrogenase catalytic domain-containing protein [Actinomycetota bacterium]